MLKFFRRILNRNRNNAVLLRDAQIGWEVLVLPKPTRDDQDRWFSDLSEARQFAAGLFAGTGWPIADVATETSARAAQRAREGEPGGLIERLDLPPFRGRWGHVCHRR